ncbi:MAG: WG repeat-containing protein [Prevotella sp.]|nr:WG repeat-containing protein [Prevotella sp.]
MKRKIILLSSILFASMVQAQVGRWLIPPRYDDIRLDNQLVITDSAGFNTIWSKDGIRLNEITKGDSLMNFVEGKSFVVRRDGVIDRLVKGNGTSHPLSSQSLHMVSTHFSNGLLRVHDGDYERFVDENGELLDGHYRDANDFANGYASCWSYQNIKKKSGPYPLLIDTKGNEVRFIIEQKKIVNVEKIMFISQVNDEDVGVIVVDKKVYTFSGKSNSNGNVKQLYLDPVFAKNDAEHKYQAKLEDDDFEKCCIIDDDNTMHVRAKFKKNEYITFCFDSQNFLFKKVSGTEEVLYNRTQEKKTQQSRLLKVVEEDDLYGISMKNGKEVIPPCFEEVKEIFDNMAFIKHNGKYGMMEVMENEEFRLEIGGNDDLKFLHKKCTPKIRLYFPKQIPIEDINLVMASDDVKITGGISGRDKNYVEYPCEILIPDTLFNLEPKTDFEVTYQAWVEYGDLVSSIVETKKNVQYFNYFDVRISDEKNDKEKHSFKLNIEVHNEPNTYDIQVKLIADSIVYENHQTLLHDYTVFLKHEGENTITAQVTEEGCPTIGVDFVMKYTKPVKDKPSGNVSTSSGNPYVVKIQKQYPIIPTKSQPRPKPRPKPTPIIIPTN